MFTVISTRILCYKYADCIWVQILEDILLFHLHHRNPYFSIGDFQSVLSWSDTMSMFWKMQGSMSFLMIGNCCWCLCVNFCHFLCHYMERSCDKWLDWMFWVFFMLCHLVTLADLFHVLSSLNRIKSRVFDVCLLRVLVKDLLNRSFVCEQLSFSICWWCFFSLIFPTCRFSSR